MRVTLPLSLPGIIAGSMLVFIPAVGEFVIPDLLGGPDTLMVGRMLWTEFFSNKDWPLASALATVLLSCSWYPSSPCSAGRNGSRGKINERGAR